MPLSTGTLARSPGDPGTPSYSPPSPAPPPSSLSDQQGTSDWGGYGQGSGFFASGSTGGFTIGADPYANEINQANASAKGFYDQGAGWQQTAAQEQNAGQGASQAQLGKTFNQQGQLISSLQAQAANPQNSLAAKQFQQNAAQGAASTTALGNSTAGGLAAAGARRAASSANGVPTNVAGLQSTEAAAQASAQQQLAGAIGQQGQLAGQQYGLENQTAAQNAQLQQQQAGVNNSTQLGLYGLSANEQGMATGAATSYNNALLAQAGASNSEQQVNNAFGNTVMGAGLSGVGAAYSGLTKQGGLASTGSGGGS
jgi:hypothetical protein